MAELFEGLAHCCSTSLLLSHYLGRVMHSKGTFRRQEAEEVPEQPEQAQSLPSVPYSLACKAAAKSRDSEAAVLNTARGYLRPSSTISSEEFRNPLSAATCCSLACCGFEEPVAEPGVRKHLDMLLREFELAFHASTNEAAACQWRHVPSNWLLRAYPPTSFIEAPIVPRHLGSLRFNGAPAGSLVGALPPGLKLFRPDRPEDTFHLQQLGFRECPVSGCAKSAEVGPGQPAPRAGDN